MKDQKGNTGLIGKLRWGREVGSRPYRVRTCKIKKNGKGAMINGWGGCYETLGGVKRKGGNSNPTSQP